MKERTQIIPACYLILFQDNKTLLLKRRNTGFQDGNYWLISWHVNPWENLTQCMIRVAYKEWWIFLNKEDLKVVHVKNRKANPPEKNERIDIFFIASKWSWEIINNEIDKCEEIKWFDLDNLPGNTIPYIKNVLADIKNDTFYSEEGF